MLGEPQKRTQKKIWVSLSHLSALLLGWHLTAHQVQCTGAQEGSEKSIQVSAQPDGLRQHQVNMESRMLLPLYSNASKFSYSPSHFLASTPQS